MPRLPVATPLLLTLAGALYLGPASLRAQDESDGRTMHWREIAVQARLESDGRLHLRERQAIVFDGGWNGGERQFDLAMGQEIQLEEIARIDPVSGTRTPLARGDLSQVDQYDWTGRNTLRWRSRREADPPFDNQELVYELVYTIGPVVVRTEGDAFLLRHDFAFARRDWAIEQFTVELTLDDAWASSEGSVVTQTAQALPPGSGHIVTLDLRRTSSEVPAVVAQSPPAWARGVVAVGALFVPVLAFLGLRRRGRELDSVAPVTPPAEIDDRWLRTHIFALPAEVVGTAWDRSVGEAEVAALLARLVEEGKLTSRVDSSGKDPVLHLHRVAPLRSFEEHERALLEGLFFDGSDDTDTRAVREHYKANGFDPAGLIRKPLAARLEALPGAGKVRRSWLPALALLLAGAAMVLVFRGQSGGAPIIVIGLLLAAAIAMIALGFAALLSRRVTHRTAPAVGVLLPLALGGVALAMLASGVFAREGGLLFYRPAVPMLLGFLAVLTGAAALATALSRPAETVERLSLRRRLVSAREYFAAELDRPEPRLQDRWFPYLLAFGLGPHVDRWFRSFAGQSANRGSSMGPLIVATGASGGHSGGGWTGGGPQFGGGGGFGGGGAGGAWSMAAAGMAAGVAAPSSGSSGGGGGGGASGGGGGGGW